MPISASATSPTQFGGFANPGAGSSSTTPFNLPGIGVNPVNPNTIKTNPNQIYQLLSNAPDSLSSTIGPLLQQVFGTSQNLMAPIFQQQGAQGAAQAQSDAMARGLTGSSIEESGIQQAYAQSNQGYNQYLAGMLQNLVPQYTQAAQFDIGNQQQYYGNLAQAVGQNYSQQQQMAMFQQQLAQQSQLASQANNTALWGAGIGAVGSLGGGFLAGL